ncbi:MAG: TIGR02453 family protein [Flavobacteriaceae bacterium]|nr:MAG: TIGR02453 family protein [Flavobacteriaceae bacterium]
MKYFSPDFNQFFKDLAKNNHTAWFKQNNERYQESVKKPFDRFLTDLLSAYREIEPQCPLEPKNAQFRINKDIRFSADKSPYKLHKGAIISNYGTKNTSFPGLYIHFGPGENFVGGGCYNLSKEDLQNLRAFLLENYSKFESLLKDPNFLAYYPGGLNPTEQNKRLPKEWQDQVAEKPLILNKRFYFIKDYTDESFVLQDNLVEIILEQYKAAKPLTDFFRSAWG